jgi:glycolate oxidase FAD binding subunit
VSDTKLEASDPMVVESESELRAAILAHDSVLVIGNASKSALTRTGAATSRITTKNLSGIIEYEPSEFTFTAHAGTPLREIVETLAARNQYLPFDPTLVQAGSTLGGCVASGLSGPGRHRFGGLRDFVLGVDLICGNGDLVRTGGKVVKNAAGFDVPKLMVGSAGSLAAMTRISMKVFPSPVDRATFTIDCENHRQAADWIAVAARQRWELDAIDYRAAERCLWLRLTGDSAAIEEIESDIQRVMAPGLLKRLDPELASENWREVTELRFAPPTLGAIAKVPITLEHLAALSDWCDSEATARRMHVSVAGAVAWIALKSEQVPVLDDALRVDGLSGMLIRQDPPQTHSAPHHSFWIGRRSDAAVHGAVKAALDPPGRFPAFGESL